MKSIRGRNGHTPAAPKKQALAVAKKKSSAAADKLIGQLTANPTKTVRAPG